MNNMCIYRPQSGRPNTEKVRFCDKTVSEWDLKSSSKIIVWGISMDMWGIVLRVLKVYMRIIVFGKERQMDEDCLSSVMKKCSAWQTLEKIFVTIKNA